MYSAVGCGGPPHIFTQIVLVDMGQQFEDGGMFGNISLRKQSLYFFMFANFNDGQKTHVMEKKSVPFICILGWWCPNSHVQNPILQNIFVLFYVRF